MSSSRSEKIVFLSIQFAFLTLCVHQILGQENVRWSDFSRGSKRYSNERAINYNSNPNLSQQKLTVADTADEFAFRRPVKKDKAYDDFLSYLYRGDKAKSKSKREIKSSDTVNVNVDAERGKRMIVFR